ncbi:hypothetical protein DL96DRAFT_1701855 [Flagelloscypha sp. PMI_526]|nr:hypothetical protein DL96DRAFT_1701855 [Flagelloscypha sp. PMI_526]
MPLNESREHGDIPDDSSTSTSTTPDTHSANGTTPIAVAINVHPASENNSLASSTGSPAKGDDEGDFEEGSVSRTAKYSKSGGPEEGYVPVESSHVPNPTVEDEDLNAGIVGTQRSVRFRSRVRITSGIPHRKRKRRPSMLETMLSPNDDSAATQHHARRGSSSSSVSESSSPSSSISAPLRYRRDSASTYNDYDDDASWRGWRPLGQRVNWFPRTNGSNEQTSLLRNGQHVRRYGVSDEEDEDYAQQLAKDIDMVFGTWPGRLLNRHWWWWQLEPICCCLCMDEYDPDIE